MNFIDFRQKIKQILLVELIEQRELWEIREEIICKIDTYLFEIVDASVFFDSVKRDQK